MRAIKKVLGFYFLLTLLSVINYACCGDTNVRIIGDGRISVFDFGSDKSYSQDETGILTGAFEVNVSHETEAYAGLSNFSLIHSTFATSCPQTFVNNLDENSFKISFDKSFEFNGETIASGTNIIDLTGIEYLVSWASIQVNFKESFMASGVFSQEAYEMTVQINTTDGILLENDMSVMFDLS